MLDKSAQRVEKEFYIVLFIMLNRLNAFDESRIKRLDEKAERFVFNIRFYY